MAGLWSDGVHQELFLVFCAQRVRQVRNIRGLDEARLFIFTLKSRESAWLRERENFKNITLGSMNEKQSHKIENIYTCI